MENPNFKPMFTLERLYWPPFTRRRGFDEDRWVTVWKPYDARPQSTGIPLIESVVTRLHDGKDATEVAVEYGISEDELATVLRVFTGMKTLELQRRWRLRMADDLLRYTSLRMDEVAKRCGYYSGSSMSRSILKYTGQKPTRRRIALRQQGDVNKFGL